MPRYAKRREVYVKIKGLAAFLYGFNTSVDTTDSGKFGHKAISGGSIANPVAFGATRPKPPRAQIKTTDGFGSTSFVDESKLGEAGLIKVDDGEPVPQKRSSSKSVRVYIPYHGLNYAWDQPKEVRDKVSDWRALGLVVLDGTTKAAIGVNYIYTKDGTKFKKPPRARKIADAVGDIDVVSSFYDPDKTLPDGWF